MRAILMNKPLACLECTKPLHRPRQRTGFCCRECRNDFNNRRLSRGAQLYDLFRALRRDRSEAAELGLWTAICRLELKWHEEDERERPGRRSYTPAAKAVAHLTDIGALPRYEILKQHKRA